MQESGCLQQGIWHRLLLVHYDGHCDACNALQRLCWLILKAPDELMRPSVSTTLLCTVHRTRAQRAANLELTHHYYNLHATARPKRTLLNLQGSSSMASKLCSSSYKIGRPIADGMRETCCRGPRQTLSSVWSSVSHCRRSAAAFACIGMCLKL